MSSFSRNIEELYFVVPLKKDEVMWQAGGKSDMRPSEISAYNYVCETS